MTVRRQRTSIISWTGFHRDFDGEPVTKCPVILHVLSVSFKGVFQCNWPALPLHYLCITFGFLAKQVWLSWHLFTQNSQTQAENTSISYSSSSHAHYHFLEVVLFCLHLLLFTPLFRPRYRSWLVLNLRPVIYKKSRDTQIMVQKKTSKHVSDSVLSSQTWNDGLETHSVIITSEWRAGKRRCSLVILSLKRFPSSSWFVLKRWSSHWNARKKTISTTGMNRVWT